MVTIMPLGDSITVGYTDETSDDNPASPVTEQDYPNYPNYPGVNPDLVGYRAQLFDILGGAISFSPSKGFSTVTSAGIEYQFVGDFYNGAGDLAAEIESLRMALDFIRPGGGGTDVPIRLAYNQYLIEQYAHQGYPGILTTEAVDPGYNLLGKIQSGEVFDITPKPDIVLLMIGSNDLYGESRLLVNGKYDPQEAANQRVGAIIDSILAESGDSEILIATVPTPINDREGVNNWWPHEHASEAGQLWNEGIEAVVATKGDNVHFVDMRGGFSTDTLMSGTVIDNGLHPSDAGYAVIANSWAEALIEPLLRKGGTVHVATTGADTFVGGDGVDTVDYSGDSGTTLSFPVRWPSPGDPNPPLATVTADGGITVAFSDTDRWGIGGEWFGDARGYPGPHYVFQGPQGLFVSVARYAVGDTYQSIEGVIATKFADRIYGSNDGTIAALGDGNDVFDNTEGFAVTDVVAGEEGNDKIWTGAGNDQLYGGPGNDFLFGEPGDDRLVGGADNDVLNGGLGNDDLWGGTGRDIFVFSGAFGRDTVHDLNPEEDLIWITPIPTRTSPGGVTYTYLPFAQVGDDTVLTLPGYQASITVKNCDVDSVLAAVELDENPPDAPLFG